MLPATEFGIANGPNSRSEALSPFQVCETAVVFKRSIQLWVVIS